MLLLVSSGHPLLKLTPVGIAMPLQRVDVRKP